MDIVWKIGIKKLMVESDYFVFVNMLNGQILETDVSLV